MANGLNIVETITEKLSQYLNKPVNANLTKSIVLFYKQNSSFEGFVNYVKILGLQEIEKSTDIYELVRDNIDKIDGILLTIELPKSLKAGPDSNQKKIKKKLVFTFDEDNLEEESVKPVVFKKIPKKGVNKVLINFNEEEDGMENVVIKPQTKFKKLKKEDTQRIKEVDHILPEVKSDSPKSTTVKPSKPLVTLSQLAQQEATLSSPSSEQDELQEWEELKLAEEYLEGVENDREWYMNDENSHPGYDDFDTDDYKSNMVQKRPKKNRLLTGGGFDEITGEYVDHDHEQSDYNDLSTIPLESHFFVPPFLQLAQEYLRFQIEGGTNIRSVGATVDPIKDPSSELALSAKKGSFVVQDKKSKKERAKRIQDTVGLTGTSIGNALGVNDDDEDDEVVNPKDQEDTTTSHTSIQEQRRTLPAYSVKEDLVRTIMENQVTIVIGETGSGKTTQLTQFLFEEGLGSNVATCGTKKMIACTQPRRVAAMSVAKRVSEEMDVKLGEEVGYSIRFEDRTNSKKTIIKYMTDGILLREILTDPLLESYLCVIMDEAHERSLNTDVLLGLFKELIRKRKDLKLIVTSATMNADRFTKFFGEAPQFTIPGRSFPVDVLYSKSVTNDYVESAVKQILTIHLLNSQNGNDGDILVFMTGQEDIEMTGEVLREKMDLLDNPPALDIFPIYSSMPADLQKKIFNKKNDKRRKVVIATNIAETSLTVDGVKYVIDCGLVKMKVYNAKLGMDTLQVIPISLANAQQRSGRAGRTGPGIAYRLYTERAVENDQMYLQPIPEIQRTNLSNVMLLLKSLKVEDINSFSFLDPPPQDLLNCSLYDLWAIGALDNLGQLTDLGRLMSDFPMEPTLAKTIILSCQPEFNCSEDIITIVAMLSVPPVYYRPKERQREADMMREKFYVNESDHLTLLNIYNQWQQNLKRLKNNYGKINHWCNSNFLQLKSLLRAKDIKLQLELIMKKNKFKIVRAKDDEDIKKCLCASFFQQLAKLMKINIHGSPEFMNLRHKYMKMHLHPTLSLNGSNLSSPYVIYHELVLTTKEYMNYVTCIQPVWLLEFGYIYYNIPDQSYRKYQDKLPSNLITKPEFLKSIEEDGIKYQQLQIAKNFKRKKVQKNNATKFSRRPF